MERKKSSEAFTSYCDCNVYRKYVSVVYCSRSRFVMMDGAGKERNASEDDEDAYESLASGEDADNEGENKVCNPFKYFKGGHVVRPF